MKIGNYLFFERADKYVTKEHHDKSIRDRQKFTEWWISRWLDEYTKGKQLVKMNESIYHKVMKRFDEVDAMHFPIPVDTVVRSTDKSIPSIRVWKEDVINNELYIKKWLAENGYYESISSNTE